MKTWQIITIIITAVILSALVTASALVLVNTPRPISTYTNYPYTTPSPQTTVPTQPTLPNQTIPSTNPGSQLTVNNAAATAQNYLYQFNNPDLAVRQVREFTQNFYVQIYERSTAIGAFELTIDKSTGNVYPETGASMTWNTKYGTGSANYQPPNTFRPGPGMMGGEGEGGWFGGTQNPYATTTIAPYQAQSYAQQYLNTYYPGTTAGQVTTFYGYFTVEVLSGATTYGLISVNGYTGQVWYHNWHGTFVQ